MKTMMGVIGIILCMPTAWASTPQWEPCWYGQELTEQGCQGSIALLSAYDARQVLRANSRWRLPTPKEVDDLIATEGFTALRQHASNTNVSHILTDEFMAHGTEFLTTTVHIESGRTELQPWRKPVLVIWINLDRPE
ncbi:hypothetical protein EGC76_10810 [Pseudidiomarina gelatinasegens]|uniref:DUF1566 domain-containing protein n=1 Tax=Pseudidiomarina gelatinasegens TaxID=2487740 RepID=A0A443YXT7_9GAMM|nr:hypothetical protein [Pseudidiomarina gelatinasegens]RWU08832.1 hypothetical protein EGC76_10810 [Pseudidiomarina gelatinasegens]